MEVLHIAILLLVVSLITAVMAHLIPKMALPLIQIAFGLVITLFTSEGGSNLSDIPFDTNIVLLGFIAPLLYNEARKANKLELLKNVRPILLLSIGLVAFTTFTVAYPLNFAVPALSLACCFALGAALGPTDPVAIASLPRKIHIGARRRAILKGESLLNDASGIVAFQFAMMFVITGTVDFTEAIGTFAIEFFGGTANGVAFGFACRLILCLINTYLVEDTVIYILFDIVTPFLLYMVADSLHLSGVVAVVWCGLLVSDTHHVNPFISKKNIALDSIWQS
ncbi:MAG: cation:proton antiporter, partial [Eggerthellaceae bacterium]|nr:cation:proton antiporter [Eggerthellaceae bacterium]